MKTVNIKGREYVEVNQRIKYFREHYKDWSIITEMTWNENWVCIFKATVIVEWKVVATWHAYEKEWSTFINKTSYIENCETSAIWRALWTFWIWIDASVASAEEVWNAIKQQKSKPVMGKEEYAKFKEAFEWWKFEDKYTKNAEWLIKLAEMKYDISAYEKDIAWLIKLSI